MGKYIGSALHVLGLFLLFCLLAPAFTQEDLSDEEIEKIELQQNCKKAALHGCNFEQWKEEYGISYESPESDRKHKFQFCKNCLFVKTYQGSFTMKIGPTTAMNEEELADYRALSKNDEKRQTKKVEAEETPENARRLNAANLPSSLDYSNYNGTNCIGSIKTQGNCRSSWAFAATALYEAQLCINNFNYELSEEAIVECTTYEAGYTNDCNRGWMEDALLYFSKVGGVLGANYPYIAGGYGKVSGTPKVRGICTDPHRIFLGPANVTVHPPLSTTEIKTLLVNKGPLIAGVYANTAFDFYNSGVFDACPSYSYYYANDAILLYGYDNQGNWLIKNAWGPNWGIGGKMVLSSIYDCGLSENLYSLEIPNINANVEVMMNITY